MELRKACQKYFPTDILERAEPRLRELFEHAREVEARAARNRERPKGGRPPGGIGADVEHLITVGYDQRAARKLTANTHEMSYEKVADLHRRWRRRPPVTKPR